MTYKKIAYHKYTKVMIRKHKSNNITKRGMKIKRVIEKMKKKRKFKKKTRLK